MEEVILTVKPKTETGKSFNRIIREQGLIPGVFYYRNELNLPFTVDYAELRTVLKKNPSLIMLDMEGQDKRECVIRELDRDPVTNEIIHIDLLGIKRGQKLRVTVPLRLTGVPVGVKTGGGILQQILSELEVECLPKDIPQRITIDVTELEIGHSLNIGDLDYPELRFLGSDTRTIASVVEPTIIKEPTAEAEEELEEGEEAEETEEEESSGES